jgi:hypothetical protein
MHMFAELWPATIQLHIGVIINFYIDTHVTDKSDRMGDTLHEWSDWAAFRLIRLPVGDNYTEISIQTLNKIIRGRGLKG